MPKIATAADLAAAMTAIADATAAGELTPAEAFDLARVADSFLRVIEARNDERRLKRWAARDAQAQRRPREARLRKALDTHFEAE